MTTTTTDLHDLENEISLSLFHTGYTWDEVAQVMEEVQNVLMWANLVAEGDLQECVTQITKLTYSQEVVDIATELAPHVMLAENEVWEDRFPA